MLFGHVQLLQEVPARDGTHYGSPDRRIGGQPPQTFLVADHGVSFPAGEGGPRGHRPTIPRDPLSRPLPRHGRLDTHVGGVLQQQVKGSWKPLGFFSRKLDSTESKYSTFDRELLACFQSIRHFRFLLEGRSFQLWTDIKPLVHAMHRVSPPWTPR
jgi:hypothetical protein